MQWTDTAIVTSIKSFGEKSKVVTCLTENHGLHKGLLKRPTLFSVAQPGALAHVTWSGRLPEHLGIWSLEAIYQPMASVLTAPLPG